MTRDDPKTLVSTQWLAAHLKDPDLRVLGSSRVIINLTYCVCFCLLLSLYRGKSRFGNCPFYNKPIAPRRYSLWRSKRCFWRPQSRLA